MLKLLLDEHVSPAVAQGLRERQPDADVLSLQEWQNGAYVEADDALILEAAARDSRTLVTYDQRTISTLLKEWAEARRSHGGVVLVNGRTIAPNDIGGQVTALEKLWMARRAEDFDDTVIYLTRAAYQLSG